MKVEQIERYLNKEMPPEEREQFEREMSEDPSLRFDVQLVACVIRKVREVELRRDRELVAQMRQGKSGDRKRFVAVVATMIAVTFTAVASLVFFGYSYSQHQRTIPKSTVLPNEERNRRAEYVNIEEGNVGTGDGVAPILMETPYVEYDADARSVKDSIKGDQKVEVGQLMEKDQRQRAWRADPPDP